MVARIIADGELPERIDSDFTDTCQASLPQAVRLRRQLIRELEAVE
jgi:hypothetical protein